MFSALMTVITPLIDGQTALPNGIFPEFLTDLKNNYMADFGDYLLMEKPHLLVGLVWHELRFIWSLSNSYLLFGASFVTSMAEILGEMIGSGKASERLLMMYVPFMGIGILALLCGLVSRSTRSIGSAL